jgi:dTDP-4-amino-4,6-dideoxygalactose transaminase
MTSWPHFDEDQINAVTTVLRSGKVNQWTGQDVSNFEKEYAQKFASNYAIALANGSVSLNLALQALDLQPGDEVIVSPRSFVVSASCVLLFGAVPVFADIDRDSQNITVETIAPLISEKTKGIIPVHLAGWPCNMPEITRMAKEIGLWVIEDCAQAHGAMIDGQHVGSFSEFGSFSFCQDKIMTTGGEGGLLTCQDSDLWAKAWSYKDHGKSYDTVKRKDHPPGFRWLHENLGTNYRMTGVSAAIGSVQLQKFDDWNGHRRRSADILYQAIRDVPCLRTPMPPKGITHAWYRFYTFVRPDKLAKGWSRDRIISEITSQGFPSFSGSCPEIYLEKVFSDYGVAPKERLPVAKELGETSLAFLVDPTISETMQNALAQCISEVCTRAST